MLHFKLVVAEKGEVIVYEPVKESAGVSGFLFRYSRDRRLLLTRRRFCCLPCPGVPGAQLIPQFLRLLAHGRIVPHRHRHMLQHLLQLFLQLLTAARGHRRAANQAQGLRMKTLLSPPRQFQQLARIGTLHIHHCITHPHHRHAEAIKGIAQGIDDEGLVIQQDADSGIAVLGVIQAQHGAGLLPPLQHLPSLLQDVQQLGRWRLPQFCV